MEVSTPDKLQALGLDNKLAEHGEEAAPRQRSDVLFKLGDIPPTDWDDIKFG